MASPRGDPDSTPICRCRVLYLGSAVPHVTKDGLQGIQEPLRELYPEQGALGARGIDSWLSVWSNGLLLENVDENHKKVTRFFPIETLHYCAAVRYVLVPEKAGSGSSSASPATPRFLPLDSPFARSPNPSHPPLFAAILRRTTGIKVLECHAFICKREMAANALVRCCFHAYADSSYARHMDGGNTSVYGTLRSQNNGSAPLMASNSIEKVEGWRQMTRGGNSGSTLTLNSHQQNNNGTLTSNATTGNISTADDISIYNGDENHKVWAGTGGSPSEREEFYGVNTMRSARSNRPRQMIAPVTSPPPPPTPSTSKDDKNNKKANKEKARRKKMMGGSREELYPLMNGSLMRGATLQHHHGNMRSSSSLSGTLIRGGGPHHYSNGTLLRPTSAHQMNGYHHPAPVLLVPHPSSTLPPGRHHHAPKRMVAGTFSHRPPPVKGNVMVAGPPPLVPVIPPNMIAAPMMPMPPPSGGKKSSKHHHHPVAVEEPIYMPSTRPLSPIASFQPGHFPHEAYLMQQYASTTMEGKHKKKGKTEKKQPVMVNGGGMPAPVVPPVVMVQDEEDDGPSPPAIVEESPFNTGIYRKKGHLNERAFSYSIRQEHRSRSYGSLASLKFATPIPNGGPPKEDMKKEREIMQMMHDLELSGDELERSEVPAAVYESRRAAATGGGRR
ncbi:uncharacterized protein [Anabrus simplex]|uniref:uncharacterized protein n=1 Tax=Anabrus simplex TaxID=316456 RepID=UPI0035A34552